ncbi:MAG TPA: peptidoglycan DD-metalloendopeptidase family protein, partial [Polyangiaceae bacterium]|nr:peptidoglycan DD-metalloendopeptidase family protein [Polyangiaceae bacterium]
APLGCAAHVDDEGTDSVVESAAELRGDGASSRGLSTRIIASPHPVTTTDERQHLLYETFIENTGTTDVTLERLDVFAPGDPTPLVTYTRDNADNVVFPVNTTTLEPFAPGAIAIVFVDVPVTRRVPQRLVQRVTATSAQGPKRGSVLEVPVDREPAITLRLPLERPRLIDLGGCCDGAHSRAAMQFSDGIFVAQRFAIDFVQLSETGVETFRGDPKVNSNYFLYGADVRAARAGQIVAVHDGMSENTPTEPLPTFDPNTAAGNYVIEKFDEQHFALYAHLRPGSIRVAVGDRVGAGCVLGAVGNTGNSFEPHLHFHVMDRASPLDANGLPYVFDEFRLTARAELTPTGFELHETPAPNRRYRRLPMQWDVVTN